MKRGWMLVAVSALLTGAGPSLAEVASSAGPENSFHFAQRISPILARNNCSAAECHGGGNGQGGFKLSLFAAVPQADYETITRELGGRRVDLAEPEESLFLKKPSRQLKHKGGRIFEVDDAEYRALMDWIAAGAPYVVGEPPELAGLEIEEQAQDGRVSVVATFEKDGSVTREDVTHLAMLESTNRAVISVEDDGSYGLEGPGEGWILARYGKFSARHAITRPFPSAGKPEEAAHPLDAVWLDRLGQLGLAAAPRAEEAVLLRRLFIDLTGKPPTPYDLAKAYELPADERIAATAERLMATPAFEEAFARHLGDWFEIPAAPKDPQNAGQRNDALRAYFLASMRAKKSLAEVTREVLTERAPQAAWKHFADPRDRAEYVGRTMLGIRIGCARCHDHPLDRWTNREHLEFAAFFADPRPAAGGAMMAGKLFLPGTNHEVTPALLPLGKGDAPAGLSTEEELAWFVLEQGGDQYSRNFANRIFETLVGKGLIDEADDHRLSNPALHEPVLDLLAARLAEDGFDLKTMVRFIITSRIYALSSEPGDDGEISGDPAVQYLARREAKPLTPVQLKAAVEQALGVTLARPEPPESPLAQQLYVMNSGLIQSGLATPGNQVDAIFEFETDPEKQLGELYRLVLSRAPRVEEMEVLLPELEREAAEPGRAGRDLAFALMASREFGSKR